MKDYSAMIREIKEYCIDTMDREEDNIKQNRKLGCNNTVGNGMAVGAFDTARDILDIIEGIKE
jgi:hypothetical protein